MIKVSFLTLLFKTFQKRHSGAVGHSVNVTGTEPEEGHYPEYVIPLLSLCYGVITDLFTFSLILEQFSRESGSTASHIITHLWCDTSIKKGKI